MLWNEQTKHQEKLNHEPMCVQGALYHHHHQAGDFFCEVKGKVENKDSSPCRLHHLSARASIGFAYPVAAGAETHASLECAMAGAMGREKRKAHSRQEKRGKISLFFLLGIYPIGDVLEHFLFTGGIRRGTKQDKTDKQGRERKKKKIQLLCPSTSSPRCSFVPFSTACAPRTPTLLYPRRDCPPRLCRS